MERPFFEEFHGPRSKSRAQIAMCVIGTKSNERCSVSTEDRPPITQFTNALCACQELHETCNAARETHKLRVSVAMVENVANQANIWVTALVVDPQEVDIFRSLGIVFKLRADP